MNKLTILIAGIFAATSIHTTSVPVVVFTSVEYKQVLCMAKNIYHEAGSEDIIGQAAVARVVLNRVKYKFAKTPCDVIYQSVQQVCQFSWVCAGKNEYDSSRLKKTIELAKAIMHFDAYNEVVPSNALFFHNKTVSPGWSYKHVKTIGNHKFYSKA